MATGPRITPGQARDTVFDRSRHYRVVMGVELDHVETMTEAVVGAKPRAIAMGVVTQPVQLAPRHGAVLRQTVGEVRCSLSRYRFTQRCVIVPEVPRREFGRLVVNLMSLKRGRIHL
jgi:hypothetical protein